MQSVLKSLERTPSNASSCRKTTWRAGCCWLEPQDLSDFRSVFLCCGSSRFQPLIWFWFHLSPGQIYLGAGSLRYPKWPPIWSAPSLCQLRLGKHADALQELQNGSEPQTHFLGIPIQIIIKSSNIRDSLRFFMCFSSFFSCFFFSCFFFWCVWFFNGFWWCLRQWIPSLPP